MKVKNQYLKILEYFLRSIKKRICKKKSSSSLKYVHLYTQYLVGGSFSTNSNISEVWHGSDQPVALMRHY